MATRRDYGESRKLRVLKADRPLGRRPSFDGDDGEYWFRSHTEGKEFRDLTMPNLVFARALVHESDLRSSDFEGCRFDGASLRGAVVTENQRATRTLQEVTPTGAPTDDGTPAVRAARPRPAKKTPGVSASRTRASTSA
jgi:hypothetical protein